MKRMICCILLGCMIPFMICAAEDNPVIQENIDVGGIHLTIDAPVWSRDVDEARTYSAQPHTFELHGLIALCWPDIEAADILACKRTLDRRMVRDGVALLADIYEYDGGWLRIDNSGNASFDTDTYSEWNTRASSSKMTEELPITSTESADDYLLDLLAAAGSDAQAARISAYGVSKQDEQGQTYQYNVYDYAIVMDQIYCENQPYLTVLSEDDFSIPPQYIQIACTQEGVISWRMQLFDVTAESDYHDIIPAQVAVDFLAEELSWYLATDTVSIYSIVLEYVMVPIPHKSRTFRYVPAWKLQTGADAWKPWHIMEGNCYRYNAINGDIIE